MAIITISRASYSRGKAVAEKVAEKLGYECLAREVIAEASEEFNVSEGKLESALHDSPSIMDRFTYSREKHIAYIQLAFLEHIKKDNVVYHGLAGQFFLKNAPNVLKVRVLANMEDRIQEVKEEDTSKTETRRLLLKDDEERRKWAQHLYDIDTTDASLYDLVINVNKLSVDDAVDIIVANSKLPCFVSNDQTQAYIDDLYLAAKAQALLVKNFPTAKVTSHQGDIHISCKGSPRVEKNMEKDIKEILKGVDSIKNIELAVEPSLAWN